jgi:hypothetical protein
MTLMLVIMAMSKEITLHLCRATLAMPPECCLANRVAAASLHDQPHAMIRHCRSNVNEEGVIQVFHRIASRWPFCVAPQCGCPSKSTRPTFLGTTDSPALPAHHSQNCHWAYFQCNGWSWRLCRPAWEREGTSPALVKFLQSIYWLCTC